MTTTLAVDWVELLVGPLWVAVVAILGVIVTLLLAAKFRSQLNLVAQRAGVTTVSVLGVEWVVDQTEQAYAERGQAAPSPGTLRGFGVLSQRLEPLVRGSTVVWIDDQPQGNRFEIRLLQRLGITVHTVFETDSAVGAVADLVIADWTRPDDEYEGIAAVRRLRERGVEAPVLFYVGEASAERRADAARAGAVAVTEAPDEMLKLALVQLAAA